MPPSPSSSNLHIIRTLLHTATTLGQKARQHDQQATSRFNLFNILGIGHLEARTHTPFLTELLDPRGTHSQGGLFLELFVKELKLEGFDARSEEVKVSPDCYIGRITDTTGGFIDLEIKDGKGSCILIENKIHAADQENQIRRYRAHNRSAHLIYLTLDGRRPAEEAATGSIDGLICISYASHILRWLHACMDACDHAPRVREALAQYILLVQALTNQNIHSKMDQEITDTVLQSRESYQAYIDLLKASSAVRHAVIKDLNEKLVPIASELGLTPVNPLRGDSSRYDTMEFSHPRLDSYHLRIKLSFETADFGQLYFGLAHLHGGTANPLAGDQMQRFADLFGTKAPFSNHHWAASLLWTKCATWTDATFLDIKFGDFANKLGELLRQIVQFIETLPIRTTSPLHPALSAG